MEKNLKLPDWFLTGLEPKPDAYHGFISSVFITDGTWCFTGPIAELFRVRRAPHRIDFGLDIEQSFGLARLTYSRLPGTKHKSGQVYEAFFLFDEEAIALIWNEMPDAIGGIPADRLTISLAPSAEAMPMINSQGLSSWLHFVDGQFLISLDPIHAGHELEALAARELETAS